MPRRLTRPEVARRIAIVAARDAGPRLSFTDLCGLFAASRRTVRDATRHTVTEWVRILAAAPMPRGRGKGGGPGIARSHVPAPAAPRHVSRVHAKLVPPEPEPVVEELPSDVEMPEPENVPEQNPDVDIPEPDDPRDPMDDPVPRPRLKRERKTD